jgi:glycerol uptake facilitator-like aquaporin
MTKPTSPLSAVARSALAEFIATALLVWIGCGGAVSSQALHVFQENPIDKSLLVSVSLAFGMAVSVLVYAVGPISGGHLNPAVTMAFCSSGLMPVSTGALYVLAQCLGAVVGAALVWGSIASPVLTNGTSPEALSSSWAFRLSQLFLGYSILVLCFQTVPILRSTLE